MHVVATAGHVDHGKSTLVRALTGTDPDRLDEEHRRGLTIELGYAWTTLPGAGDVAFVDVPGHERFLTTMLSGIGPVPAVLLVVAADDPWMPQAAEHLAALDALGVAHGVVAVTRSDLTDPGPAGRRAAAEIARTSLRGAPVVPVSARTGDGLAELRTHLATMLGRLPAPDPAADVRLWVDRRFTIRGAGTVVTGTLPAGTIARGDGLSLGDRRLRVRAVQTLESPVERASGVARVALNLTGDDLSSLERGSVLVTPDAWHVTDVLDVRLREADHAAAHHAAVPDSAERLRDEGSAGRAVRHRPPERPVLHVGATSLSAHCRPLGGDLARLTLDAPLPLRVGDRALLRDPGSRRLWGVLVLDPAPPPLRRRGAARDRAAVLADVSGVPDPADEIDRRELVHTDLLRRIGVPLPRAPLPSGAVAAGGWLMSASRAGLTARRVAEEVASHAARTPLDPWVPLAALAESTRLPTPALVEAVVPAPLRVEDGRVGAPSGLPERLESALAALARDLATDPFSAPTADRMVELGLDQRAVAAAAKAGRLVRVAPGIVLLPGADRTAAAWLSELPQPFTASEARTRLGTTRRVVLPLLDHLDRAGLTRRHPDDRRSVVT